MPSAVLNFQTPLQNLSSYLTIPSILTLPPRIFGCVAYVHVPKNQRTKIEPCAEKCIFLGYGLQKKGYKCYNPLSDRVYVTRDVTFLETEGYYQSTKTHFQEESNLGENVFCPVTLHDGNGENRSPCINNGLGLDSNSGPAGPDQDSGPAGPDLNSGPAGPDLNSGPAGPDQNSGPSELMVGLDDPNTTDQVEERTESKGPGENNSVANLKYYTRRKRRLVSSSQNIEGAFRINEEDTDVIQLPPSPHGPAPEDIPEVNELNSITNQNSSYELPHRYNRGKAPKRFISDEWNRRSCSYPISNYVSGEHLPEKLKGFTANVSTISIPESVEEALRDQKWTEAMKAEMEALEKNCTWKLVELPMGKKTVGCKWIFSLKYNANGEIERYKARLVAKGYTQTYGIDFQETFSPVAKLNTIRVLLSIAANRDWPLHQFDVKNAFLHGNLEEEIYMDIPPGYTHTGSEAMVCKLEKSLYGLKQSPRAWFGRFSKVMKEYGYRQSDSDHTLFLKHNHGKLTALIIYVDDMVITGDDMIEIKHLEEKLSREFEMKNLGGLKYFLGIEVTRSRDEIVLSQRKYILDLLAEVGMLDCKPADTPTIQNQKLGNDPDQVPTNTERYQKLVGKLIYLSHTRPDIAYAVSMVSQFMHSPSEIHMDAVVRILRYLKGSPGRGIRFRKIEHLKITGYTDADWAGSVTDRKSTAGYFTFVGGNLVTWRSKKQNVVALSSAEAEFRGMSKGLCELLWLRKLMTELGYGPQEEMELFYDNKAAIDISHNPVQHDRTKHVEIDRHFIKNNLEEKIIRFPFVRSEDQLADILTKAVSAKSFDSSLDKLGMIDIYHPT